MSKKVKTTVRPGVLTMVLMGTGLGLLGLPVGQSAIGLETAVAQQPAVETAEPAATGGPAMVRRLTESQYRASVSDIFGPDIPILGRFERGLRENGLLAVGTSQAGISSFSLEQYHVSAQGIAAAVFSEAHRGRLVPCRPRTETAFDAACAGRFIEQYGPALFRRPLSSEERARLLKTAQAAQQRLGSFDKGLQFTLAGMLVAPEFLLRIERTVPDRKGSGQLRLDPWSMATRLSFLLTDATPDAELLRATGAGELDTRAGLDRQADRLIASPKFERAVRAFFNDMLALEEFTDLTKDTDIFPAYGSKLAADAQEQTLRTITDLLVDRKGDYRDIFTTRDTFLSRSLGIVYRLPVASRYEWEKAQFPANSGRSGILSHVSFLALNAHPGISSPTLRGKFIRQTFLCQRVPDPPPNVDFSKFEGPKAVMPTARARLIDHNESPACSGCHKLTDPMGLALENFDGVGTFRTHENGSSIDVSGELDGKAFSGPVELGQALRNNPQTSQCLVQKMYQAGVGHSASTQESYLEYLDGLFRRSGYRLHDLMRSIAVSRAFYAVSAPEPAKTVLNERTNGDRS